MPNVVAKHVTITTDLKSFESMSVIIKKENWWICEGQTKPMIECPNCGSGILGDPAPHGIRADGSVYASVVCQNDKCNFHSYVKLEGWEGGDIPHS